MPYRFAKGQQDYSDLASGRVFYSLPGHPAFPIRLADEILQRCLAIRQAADLADPINIYDPCCGVAYHLSVLAYLHWHRFRAIIASDIDHRAVEFARKNLSLLSKAGMDQRIGEIVEMLGRYEKRSHQEALESVHRLHKRVTAFNQDHPLKTSVFQANALDQQALVENLEGIAVDLVFADVPYGLHSQWREIDLPRESGDLIWRMLEALSGVLAPNSLVVVVSDKGQKASHERYQRIEQLKVGRRRAVILKPGC